MVLGIVSAIASAILLALAGVLIKSQLSQRDPITLNALQSVVASLAVSRGLVDSKTTRHVVWLAPLFTEVLASSASGPKAFR